MIAIIAARSGSRGIPQKNVRLLGGKPLLVWSIETAKRCGLEPVVSSESMDYLELAKQHGARVVLRPERLSLDTTPMFSVVEHAVWALGQEAWPQMVLLQPTVPLRKDEEVKSAIKHFIEGDFDSVITAIRIPEKWHPDEALQEVEGRIQMASGVPVRNRKTRRQDYNKSWVPSGSCYVIRTRNIEEGSLYGQRVGIQEVEGSVNINDEDDWHAAESLVKTWTP